MTVPARFAAELEEEAGEEGPRWLAGLPGLVTEFLTRWELTVDGATMHGAAGIVIPVRRADGTPAVLKLTWPHEEAEHEALALSIWAGQGSVRLLAHDSGSWAMLLERLDPNTSLLDVPITDAVQVIAGLIPRLDRTAPPQVRTLRDTAARWVRDLADENAGGPVPAELVDLAVGYCAELGPGCRRPPGQRGSALRQRAARRARTMAADRPEADYRRSRVRADSVAVEPV